MSAKKKHNLSKFVGFTYIRMSGAQGWWFELASARATVATIDTTAQSVDVVCDTRWSVFKGVIPEALVGLTFLENADTTALAKLFGLTETTQAAGTKSLSDESFTFGTDDKIVLPYYSNDDNGLTTPVVKDSTWVTTYVLDTDYSVTVVDNETTITRLWGGAITEGENVLVSGDVEVNASEKVSMVSEFTLKEEFEVMIIAKITTDGVDYRRTIKLDPATLESTYALEFLDVVKAGDINWASVEFKLSEWGTFEMYDEIITDAISG